MKTLNKVQLMGFVGNDPKIYAMASGKLVARFSLATHRFYKDKATNILKTHTDWHNIVVYDLLAELAERFIEKGTAIHLSGSINTRIVEEAENSPRTIIEVIGQEMILIDKIKSQQKGVDFSFLEEKAITQTVGTEVVL